MYIINRITGLFSIIFAILIVLLPQYDKIIASLFVLLMFIVAIIERFVPKTILINGGKTRLILEYGDILEKRGGVVVIPVDRNYNTVVDDRVISHKSIHGQFIDKKLRSPDEARRLIGSKLSCKPDEQCAFKQQSLGNIVAITVDDSEYYLLALSQLDSHYKAHCSYSDYMSVFNSLLDYADEHLNGRVLYMPLIGNGLSDVFGSIDDTEALKIMCSMIRLGQKTRISEIHIVINKNAKTRVKIHNVC